MEIEIKRRCPICDRITSMYIEDRLIKNNDVWGMGVIEGKFFKYGDCRRCQNVVRKTIKTMKGEIADE